MALLETNPYLLALTIVVSIVHSVFEFLAFKNGKASPYCLPWGPHIYTWVPCFTQAPPPQTHTPPLGPETPDPENPETPSSRVWRGWEASRKKLGNSGLELEQGSPRLLPRGPCSGDLGGQGSQGNPG